MNDAPYTVLATFKAKPGNEQRMKELFTRLLAPSRAEDGCLDYYWYQSLDDPGRFVLYMNWRDRAAFDAHVRTSHVREAEQALEGILAEPSTETVWQSLG